MIKDEIAVLVAAPPTRRASRETCRRWPSPRSRSSARSDRSTATTPPACPAPGAVGAREPAGAGRDDREAHDGPRGDRRGQRGAAGLRQHPPRDAWLAGRSTRSSRRAMTFGNQPSAAGSGCRSSSSAPTPRGRCTSATGAGRRSATRWRDVLAAAGYHVEQEYLVNDG